MATLAVKQLQLAPLGAGDLIDRTVRLYRRHFGALLRASAPPVVISAVGTVIWSISVRSISATGSEGRLALYVLTALLGAGVYILGLLAQLIVTGGASRNLVMHLLSGEPVTARLIYRSVRSRFGGLLGASLIVFLWLLLSCAAAAMALMLVLIPLSLLATFAFALLVRVGAEWLALVLLVLLSVGVAVVVLYVFFFVAGRVAYVPQVMMVEGRSLGEAIGRSAELARGNVRRLMGMFLFTGFANYSAVMLLLVPLGWFAYLNGVNPFEMDATRVPAWYTISSEVLWQLATIMLAPLWIMGLSLLYVDERVRHEGYDIELLAAQVFGEMPAVPEGLRAPLAPAIASPRTRPTPEVAQGERPPGSILGL